MSRSSSVVDSNWIVIDEQTVKLKGEWTLTQVEQAWPEFSQLEIDTLELSELTRIDSAGLAAMISVFVAHNRAKVLTLNNASHQLEQLIGLYGLNAMVQLGSMKPLEVGSL